MKTRLDRSALLQGLFQTIDTFVGKVSTRYPGELACRAGCASCCAANLTVTEVEAETIRQHLGSLETHARGALAESANNPNGESCVALDSQGRCRIYEARPVVCRSHGVPIRFRSSDDADPRRRLPVIDACSLNFTSTPLEAVSADCVLDQETLSVALGRIDRVGRPPQHVSERIALESILAAAHTYPPTSKS